MEFVLAALIRYMSTLMMKVTVSFAAALLMESAPAVLTGCTATDMAAINVSGAEPLLWVSVPEVPAKFTKDNPER